MRIRSFFEKEIVPLYRNKGFQYDHFASDDFRFADPTDSILVEYRFYKRNSPLFSNVPSEINIALSLSFGHRRLNFYPDRLKGIEPGSFDYFCANDTEIQQAFYHSTDRLLHVVLPRLFQLRDCFVPINPQYYTMLANHPEEQAKQFSTVHNRSMIYSSDNYDWATQWLYHQIPDDYVLRQTAFEQKLDQIIQLTAFCGEMIRSRIPGEWRWIDAEPPIGRLFGIGFDPSAPEPGYNVLCFLMDYWNFAKDFHHCTLFLPKMQKMMK